MSMNNNENFAEDFRNRIAVADGKKAQKSVNNKDKGKVNLRNRLEIAEGKKTQEDAKFSPSIFGTVDGASRVKHPDNFHRPAEPRTQAKYRVQQYMNDKDNQEQTDRFMDRLNNKKYQ